jgi:uncharacterized heparinase superfamily protein
MNISCRLISFFLIIATNSITPPLLKTLLNEIDYEATVLKKHIEYHIPGNHLFFNAFALWLYGTFINLTPEKSVFQKKGIDLLVSEIKRQFLADGVHCELSPHYHQEVLLLLIQWCYLLKLCGNYTLYNRIFETVGVALPAMIPFIRPNFTLAGFGDTGPGLHPTPPEKNINLVFEQANCLLGIKSNLSTRNHFFLPESGFYAFRSSGHENADYFIIKGGDLGYYPNTGHAHSDIGHFELHLGGHPVLVDAGTYRYSNDPLSLWFKKARSHNTVCFDNKDHASLVGFFRWAFLPKSNLKLTNKGRDYFNIQVSTSSFSKLGLHYSRKVSFKAGKELLVHDYVTIKNGSRLIEINFHFHPSIRLNPKDNGIIIFFSNKKIFWQVPCQLQTNVKQEYHAEKYGVLSKSPHVSLTGILKKNSILINRFILQ